MRRSLANKAQGSLTVSIKREGQTDLTGIPARIGETSYESDGVGIGIILGRDTDFIILASDYSFGEPVPGDVIVSSHEGSQKEYLVGNRAGAHCFEPHDRRGYELRVHTVQSDEVV